MKKLSKEQRQDLIRIVVSAILLLVFHFLPLSGVFAALCYLLAYLPVGYEVLRKAGQRIVRGQVLDENFLMSLASVGAFAIGDYPEAVFIILFYQIGELFQDCAVDSSRRSIAALLELRPEIAHLQTGDGVRDAAPEEIAVGSVLIVKPGERIPLDGTVLDGVSALDASALTGESVPQEIRPGDAVFGGCVNLTGLLRVQVTKPCGESTVSKILELVEHAGEKKASSEQFITRFARYYTPAVVTAALALFLIPSAILLICPQVPAVFAGTVWQDWLHRALVFLVISCPCALVISVPLSFFGGIGGASRCGILIKGGNYLETLARADTVAFDKTGTLTEGEFSVAEIVPARGFTAEQVLFFAASAEQFSDHPISRSLRRACGTPADRTAVSDVQEVAGMGVLATVEGRAVAVGNRRMMEQLAAACSLPDAAGTVVYVAIDGTPAGLVRISDRPKPTAKAAISALKALGIRRTVMLTGDASRIAAAVTQELGVDVYHAELLPADKVQIVENLIHSTNRNLIFVGDGINDAPVLARADVGIAMGALGSDAAIEAADVVLMDDDPARIPLAIRIARRTVRIVRQNIAFALTVKAVILILGAVGIAPIYLAVFADVGVAFLAILNAMRALRVPK